MQCILVTGGNGLLAHALKEIAPRAGLGNEYAMSRLFRRIFRLPPGQYRGPRQ